MQPIYELTREYLIGWLDRNYYPDQNDWSYLSKEELYRLAKNLPINRQKHSPETDIEYLRRRAG